MKSDKAFEVQKVQQSIYWSAHRLTHIIPELDAAPATISTLIKEHKRATIKLADAGVLLRQKQQKQLTPFKVTRQVAITETDIVYAEDYNTAVDKAAEVGSRYATQKGFSAGETIIEVAKE